MGPNILRWERDKSFYPALAAKLVRIRFLIMALPRFFTAIPKWCLWLMGLLLVLLLAVLRLQFLNNARFEAPLRQAGDLSRALNRDRESALKGDSTNAANLLYRLNYASAHFNN